MTVLKDGITVFLLVLAGIAVIYTPVRNARVYAVDFNIPASATFNLDAATLNLPGTITIANAGTLVVTTGMITISNDGNWSKSGAFTAGSSTVYFTGTNHAIKYYNAFYNLTCTVATVGLLTFGAAQTQTITNTLTLRCTPGNYLYLQSSVTGTQWKIDPQGTRDIDYVTVQDSNNINATRIIPANWRDSGNNTNWGPAPTPTPDGGVGDVDFPTPTPTATVTPTATATPTATPTPTPTPAGDMYLSKDVAYLSGDTIVITVEDADRNTSPTSAEVLTTAVKVTELTSNTSLLLDVNEGGVNSGIFLATIKTGTVTSGGASSVTRSNSGTIMSTQGGTATVVYKDTVPVEATITKTLSFSSYNATLAFDADTYSPGSYAGVTLMDAERNTDNKNAETLADDVLIETVSVRRFSRSSFNSAKVLMVETGTDTGTFMGMIQVVSSGGTIEYDQIQANVGDTLKVSYLDAINMTGLARIATDTASVVAVGTATGNIIGRVVDPNDAGINGATASLITGGDTVKTTTTSTIQGADGTYVFSDVTIGNYEIVAVKAGYKSDSTTVSANDFTQTEQGIVATADDMVLTQTACETVSDITANPTMMTLKSNTRDTITITVTGEGGCPIVGDTVKAAVADSGDKDLIKVLSPKEQETDGVGQAVFTIEARDKEGTARVKFKEEKEDKKVYVDVTVVTAIGCVAEDIEASPASLTLVKKESGTITVTVTGVAGCLVEGETVRGYADPDNDKLAKVSPEAQKTNSSGQAVFTVKAKKKGNETIKFKVNKDVKVHVDVDIIASSKIFK